MARILAIDYGQKRIGIAATDPLQMIANGLTTVETPKIYSFLAEYFTKEEVETIVVGYPKTLQNEPAEVTKYINTFVGKCILNKHINAPIITLWCLVVEFAVLSWHYA